MTVAKVALVQFESSPGVEANTAKMVALVQEAAASGAELVLFHELATTDYFCYDDSNPEHFALAEPIPGPATSALVEAAHRTGAAVLLPMYELDGSTRYNTVVYIDPERGITGKYRKTHVPVLGETNGQKGADESYYFSPGDTGFVLPDPVAGVSVGSLVCYDRHFPESGRSYALRGAQLLFVPTASYRDSIIKVMWKTELQAFAYQNSVYVVGVNKVGPVPGGGVTAGSRYPGHSVVFDPEGKLILELGEGGEIGYADIDTDFVDSVRHGAMRFLAARRPEAYDLLTHRR